MDAVVEESERLKRIFSKILVYARNEELRLKPIDVVQLLDKILLLFESSKEFSKQSVEVIKKYNDEKIMMRADEEQMADMFSNVIRNAYEAMPKGGKLTLNLTQRLNEVEIVVLDTGEGMTKETMKGLFVPFKTTKKMGTGIGLSQAHKIITMHEGKIQIASKPKLGTEIKISLPLNA